MEWTYPRQQERQPESNFEEFSVRLDYGTPPKPRKSHENDFEEFTVTLDYGNKSSPKPSPLSVPTLGATSEALLKYKKALEERRKHSKANNFLDEVEEPLESSPNLSGKRQVTSKKSQPTERPKTATAKFSTWSKSKSRRASIPQPQTRPMTSNEYEKRKYEFWDSFFEYHPQPKPKSQDDFDVKINVGPRQPLPHGPTTTGNAWS